MGGRGSSSLASKQGGFHENTHMENLALVEGYAYAEPTEDEEREIFRYTQGETNWDIRVAQARYKEELEDTFKAGREEGWSDSDIKAAIESGDLPPYKTMMNHYGDVIEGYIARSPNYTGTVYRGIEQSGYDYGLLKGKKPGDSVSFNSLTSWTFAKDVASKGFTHSVSSSGKPQRKVLLVTGAATKNNALISKYSANLEGEVLMSGNNQFRVRKIMDRGDAIYYYLD